jgi:hypothetical protein
MIAAHFPDLALTADEHAGGAGWPRAPRPTPPPFSSPLPLADRRLVADHAAKKPS